VEEQLGEASSKVAEYEVTIGALQTSQTKLQSENAELSSQLADAESKNGSLSKNNTNLSSHLDEVKSELEMEITVSIEYNLAWAVEL
jgi:chromosome segregation ATPase